MCWEALWTISRCFRLLSHQVHGSRNLNWSFCHCLKNKISCQLFQDLVWNNDHTNMTKFIPRLNTSSLSFIYNTCIFYLTLKLNAQCKNTYQEILFQISYLALQQFMTTNNCVVIKPNDNSDIVNFIRTNLNITNLL